MTDEELVAALRSGSRDAAAELARRYAPAIQRFCRSYLHDEARAEDVAQDTFAKLTPTAELPAGAVKPWLYRVARNRCLDLLRRDQRSPTGITMATGFDAARPSSGPQTRAVKAERGELIRQILAQMPEDYRDVLILKYYEGLSREEIAEALAVSEATVKGRLVRASEYLRDELRRITESFS